MKLINDFYHIVSTESADGNYVCKVRLNADHDFYRVHFPGNPVTPGVCLVQMATEMLEQKYNRRFLLSKAVNIKFKQLVAPDDEPRFVFSKLEFVDDTNVGAGPVPARLMDNASESCNGSLKVLVSIEDDYKQFVKMSLLFSPLTPHLSPVTR